MPPRRSARQQHRTGQLGSSSQPILIPDSPSSIPVDSITTESTTEVTQKPSSIAILPSKLASQLPGLTKKGVKLLQFKQQQLQSPISQIHQLPDFCDPKDSAYPWLKEAVDATLVFAQEEAGTAVCISTEGLILTCSHCVAECPEELDMDKIWWLIFASGQIVQAKTVKWDAQRDLALLRIIAAQSPLSSPPHHSLASPSLANLSHLSFPHSTLASSPPKPHTRLLCVGHPGSEDLEVSHSGVQTGYDVLHLSTGRFRGYAKGQDVQDNSEIGALMHDCWTYWGHSGAPLVEMGGGGLVGVHSSWDDESGMRRGVGWVAIREFLGDFKDEKLDLE
ncbi:trypsin-like serine protease [Melanomma pulvis-pyrius CBS 109.77]|uniref:Trypsin-like serine protease n=1 Tax=Melanomma pulvis-pyrius CBS 109.77 TaxID=1314802 RepID=A0A6A6X8F3_9PLEO|nr:trypsin-like serine protease [Melanomma pulvis-pyrius CBS 109.77]